MYSVNINGEAFQVENTKEGLKVNDKILSMEVKDLMDKKVHLIKKDQSIEAELIRLDRESKTLEIRVGNKTTIVKLKDKNDLLLEKLGLNQNQSAQLKEIKAPMPGLILEMKVEPGDEVKKGDVVLILEAMKMENIIKSPGDGVVKSIKAELGESVEKNQVLIQF